MIDTLKDRFETKYIPEPNSGCWLWVGALNKQGYGRIFIAREKNGSRSKSAHRMSWTIYRGSIPDGMLVCHTCDIPMCVNPDHLWLGTHKDNTLDCHTKGRAWNGGGLPGVKNGRATLTKSQVREIRKSKEPVKYLAKKYKLHFATIYKIKSRKLWNTVK